MWIRDIMQSPCGICFCYSLFGFSEDKYVSGVNLDLMHIAVCGGT